jgi:hypothetical protein
MPWFAVNQPLRPSRDNALCGEGWSQNARAARFRIAPRLQRRRVRRPWSDLLDYTAGAVRRQPGEELLDSTKVAGYHER